MNFEQVYIPTLLDYNYIVVVFILCLLFFCLYFFINAPLYYLVRFLNLKGITKPITKKPFFKNQILFEIKQSLWSVLIFGLYGTLIVFLYRQRFLEIGFQNNIQILLDLGILIIWNELHFFLGHQLMHSKNLVKFHRIHHKSVVVNPFSTYSFHPLESIIMGSVMIIPLLVYPLEIWAMIIFPIYHLLFNAIGHTNVAFVSKKSKSFSNSISLRHNLHHTKFSINYGFVSTLTDRLVNLFNKK